MKKEHPSLLKDVAHAGVIIVLLSVGIAAALFLITSIDVAERQAYWEAISDYPNMDPRIAYVFSLFVFVTLVIVAFFTELIRTWMFDRKALRWWQIITVGGSYSSFYSWIALRHYSEFYMSGIGATVIFLVFNPVTVYCFFRGYRRNYS